MFSFNAWDNVCCPYIFHYPCIFFWHVTPILHFVFFLFIHKKQVIKQINFLIFQNLATNAPLELHGRGLSPGGDKQRSNPNHAIRCVTFIAYKHAEEEQQIHVKRNVSRPWNQVNYYGLLTVPHFFFFCCCLFYRFKFEFHLLCQQGLWQRGLPEHYLNNIFYFTAHPVWPRSSKNNVELVI